MQHKLCTVVLSIATVLSISNSFVSAQSPKTRHVRDEIRSGRAQSAGRLPSNQLLQLDFVLPLRDQAGLESLLKDLYDPANPSFHQFLTPRQFTERFGPTQEQYDAVVRFAQTYGFQIVGGSRDTMDVQVKGTVGVIEAALHVNMRTFKHPTENRDFYGTDSEPTPDLPFSLWHVSGLDNYSIPHALVVNRNDFAKAHGIDAYKVVSHATTGSGPSSSFLGSDMRAAYYGSGLLDGAGQTVGLLEYYGTNITDLQTYFTNAQQPDLSGVVSLISTDTTSISCNYPACDDTEQTLDMTQALGMAPGLASLEVFVGSTDTAMIGAMTAPPKGYALPTAIGCSWGWTPVDPSTLDPYFQRMAAQGQSFFVASGDNSTWRSGNYPWPAEDANVVTVGGTDLVTASAGAWSSETAWVDSGGGISPHRIAIPSWQKASGVINSSNRGSTTYRNGPDVSANANFTFYVCANQTTCTANSYGGTSFAAPMWAAYIALVNQQLAKTSQSPIGFLNPMIYAMNESGGSLSSSYATNFHDITSGTSGSYSAVKGYDLVTGWGSPNSGLMAALTGAAVTPVFTVTPYSKTLSVRRGSSGSLTINTAVSQGYVASISLSASGQGGGTSISFSPPSIMGGNGSSTMKVSATKGATTGTFIVTVNGTGGGVTIPAPTITLTVQ
jgi:kumamolisin